MTVGIVPAIPFEQESRRRSRKDIRRMFVVAKICVSFIIRMKNLKQQKLAIDREELRKRPFRRREVRDYISNLGLTRWNPISYLCFIIP